MALHDHIIFEDSYVLGWDFSSVLRDGYIVLEVRLGAQHHWYSRATEVKGLGRYAYLCVSFSSALTFSGFRGAKHDVIWDASLGEFVDEYEIHKVEANATSLSLFGDSLSTFETVLRIDAEVFCFQYFLDSNELLSSATSFSEALKHGDPDSDRQLPSSLSYRKVRIATEANGRDVIGLLHIAPLLQSEMHGIPERIFVKHFLSLMYKNSHIITIDLSMDYHDANSDIYFPAKIGLLLDSSCPLISISSREGRIEDLLRSRGDALLLVAEEECSEIVPRVLSDYSDVQLFESHKTGGFPFFEHLEGLVLSDAIVAFSQGYRLLLQLSFPSSNDADCAFSWPFFEFPMHIYVRQDLDKGTLSFLYSIE